MTVLSAIVKHDDYSEGYEMHLFEGTDKNTQDGAFMHNKLESLRIGANLFTIPHSAFSHNKLSRLVLPENAQEIQADAFADNHLTSIIFEGAPTFIHRHAFNLGTDDMTHVTVTGADASSLRALLDHHAKYVDDYRTLAARY